MVFTKEFETDSKHSARTLSSYEVTDDDIDSISDSKKYWGVELSKDHDDGWTISGEVHYDYFTWVNDFQAVHPTYGRVWGDFEDIVYADSEEGYNHFVENHPYNEWDYWDI